MSWLRSSIGPFTGSKKEKPIVAGKSTGHIWIMIVPVNMIVPVKYTRPIVLEPFSALVQGPVVTSLADFALSSAIIR
jgi:hypothetical protein